MFSSVTPAPTTYTATFENGTMATETTNFLNYPTGGNRSALELFDHTDFSGSTYTYSNLLNGGNNSQVGLAKTIKVYPGDKVKLEAFAKYYNPQGTGNLSGFAAALTTAFGVSAASTGEAALAYQTLNTYGGVVAGGGGNGNSSYPKAFVTILLFDKDYKLVDFTFDQINGGQQVGVSPKAAHDAMMCEYTVKEAGYAYMYISNENPTMVEVYFDDIAVTYTPSNLIQGNEYYPFGMQTANSWTRDGNKNDYLYNQGTELNATSGWYETFFRGYDPALGKFLQVDPMTDKYASWTPYNYGFNSPGVFNDPLGAEGKKREAGGDRNPDHHDAHAGMYGNAFDRADAFFNMLNGLTDANAYMMTYGTTISGGSGVHSFGPGSVPGSYYGSGRMGHEYNVYERWMDWWNPYTGMPDGSDFLGYRYERRNHISQDSYQEYLKDFLLSHFGSELRALNMLGQEKNTPIRWWIDPKGKYTGSVHLPGKTIPLNGKIYIVVHAYPVLKAMDGSPELLKVVLTHEFQHARDELEGWIAYWRSWYGEETGYDIAEYNAYKRSAEMEATLGVDFGSRIWLNRLDVPSDYLDRKH